MLKLIDRILGDFFIYFFPPAKKIPQPTKINRILIIKLVAMGDLIVISPLLQTLQQHYPTAKIDLLTTPRVKSVVEHQNLYNKIYYLKFNLKFIKSFVKNWQLLKKQKYDLVLDLEFYYRITSIFTYLIKPNYCLGWSSFPMRSKIYNQTIKYNQEIHVAETFLDFASILKIVKKIELLKPITYSIYDKNHVNILLKNIPRDFILIHIGTSNRAKSRRWTNKNWTKIFNELVNERNDPSITPQNIVLTGGTIEGKLLKKIILPTKNTFNLIGKTNIPQLAYLMTKAKLFIGLDTGPTHIAAAMGITTIGLYGPNSPKRWGPYSINSQVIYHELSCSECTRQFAGQVSKCKNNICLQIITVNEVIEKIHKII